jgi:hypothetical protein
MRQVAEGPGDPGPGIRHIVPNRRRHLLARVAGTAGMSGGWDSRGSDRVGQHRGVSVTNPAQR